MLSVCVSDVLMTVSPHRNNTCIKNNFFTAKTKEERSMKKTMKKALCLALALLMFVSVMGVGAFADKSVKQYKTYVCLGDSVASGYGLPSYEATVDPYKGSFLNEEVVWDGSYCQIVGDAVGARCVESRAHSGWRACDYLKMMGYTDLVCNDPYVSEYGENFFIQAIGWLGSDNPNIKGSGERAKASIKKADLITLNLGCNDLFSYAQAVTMYTVSNRLGWGSIYQIPKTADGIAHTFTSLLKTLSEGDVKELVSTYIGALMAGARMYEDQMPKLVKVIKDLNPDVTLVLVGMANPVCVNLPFDIEKELGIELYSHFDYYCERENGFLQNLAAETGSIYADVDGTDIYGIKYLDIGGALTGDMLGVEVSGVKMVHPTPDGHAYMAAKILQALPGYDGELSSLPFLDVPADAWYYNELEYCYDKGIAKGTTATTFSPNATVTRGQLATFLYRMAGSPSIAGMSIPFTDVPNNNYHDAIVWAYNAGVVKGFTDTTFAPGNPVTRGQAVTMICRFANGSGSSTSYSQFKDASSIPTAYCGAVSWAVDKGIIKGYDDGCFHQNDALSRAQMVVMLARYCQA